VTPTGERGVTATSAQTAVSGAPTVSTVEEVATERGTTIPLVLLCFLLAGTLVTASTAASAAFLAQRDLAGRCDGAAVAAATAVVPIAAGNRSAPVDGSEEATPALRLDPARVAATVARYRAETAVDGGPPMAATASTDGVTVTVTCHRTVRIPFGAVLGHPRGLERTAVARARSPLLPPDGSRPST
jgi:hypothetical protein